MALPDLIRSNRSLFSEFFRDLDSFFDMGGASNRRVFSQLFRDMDDLLASNRAPLMRGREQSWVPAAVDVQENDNSFLLSFEMPGVRQEDIKVDVSNNILTVSGERFQELTEGERAERSAISFQRSLTLPTGTPADQIQAQYENGVLDVVIPKSSESQRRSIEIQQGRASTQLAGKTINANAGASGKQAASKKKSEQEAQPTSPH